MSEGMTERKMCESDYELLFVVRDMINLFEEQQRGIYGKSSERLERVRSLIQYELEELSE